MNIKIVLFIFTLFWNIHAGKCQKQEENISTVFDINNYKVSSIAIPVSDTLLIYKKINVIQNRYFWKNIGNKYLECLRQPIIVRVESSDKIINYCLACSKGSEIEYISNCISEKNFHQIE
jgi:hypothetical protein